jgi:hypothetical protein
MYKIGLVTDGEVEECVDPGGNGAILNVGESGGPGRQERREADSWHQTVEEVRSFKMLESSRDGLGTTRIKPHAQSTYHMCDMCINLL